MYACVPFCNLSLVKIVNMFLKNQYDLWDDNVFSAWSGFLVIFNALQHIFMLLNHCGIVLDLQKPLVAHALQICGHSAIVKGRDNYIKDRTVQETHNDSYKMYSDQFWCLLCCKKVINQYSKQGLAQILSFCRWISF